MSLRDTSWKFSLRAPGELVLGSHTGRLETGLFGEDSRGLVAVLFGVVAAAAGDWLQDDSSWGMAAAGGSKAVGG